MPTQWAARPETADLVIGSTPGAEFMGPLPDELQNFTGVAAGTPTRAKQPEAVAAFIKFLKGPAAGAR